MYNALHSTLLKGDLYNFKLNTVSKSLMYSLLYPNIRAQHSEEVVIVLSNQIKM